MFVIADAGELRRELGKNKGSCKHSLHSFSVILHCNSTCCQSSVPTFPWYTCAVTWDQEGGSSLLVTWKLSSTWRCYETLGKPDAHSTPPRLCVPLRTTQPISYKRLLRGRCPFPLLAARESFSGFFYSVSSNATFLLMTAISLCGVT